VRKEPDGKKPAQSYRDPQQEKVCASVHGRNGWGERPHRVEPHRVPGHTPVQDGEHA
jgi:hypothetical protein